MANYLDISGLKKVFEVIRDYLADNFLGKSKADVEEVLTGNITSHTHSYLPTAGGSVSGDITLEQSAAIRYRHSDYDYNEALFYQDGDYIILGNQNKTRAVVHRAQYHIFQTSSNNGNYILGDGSISWSAPITTSGSGQFASLTVDGTLSSASAAVSGSLTVGGRLNCWEMVSNTIRSSNGMIFVTDSAVVTGIGQSNSALTMVYIAEATLAVGDIVIMRKSGETYTMRVGMANDSRQALLQHIGSAPTIEVGDQLFRVGSTADESRQTGILLSPYDGGYIDFYRHAGTTDAFARSITTSLGALDHLGIAGVNGYGLYSDNAYITGEIHATALSVADGVTADNLTVRRLETASSGARIVAQGHDLQMLDELSRTRLRISGDSYDSIEDFVEDAEPGAPLATLTGKTLEMSATGVTLQTVTDYSVIGGPYTIPSSGHYDIEIPNITGQISVSSTLTAQSSGIGSLIRVTASVQVVDTTQGVTLATLGSKSLYIDESGSQVAAYTFSGSRVPATAGN